MPKILVIEDDATSAQVLSAVLHKGGFDPVVAATGAGALRELRKGDVVGVCLDILLPDCDGDALLKEVRELFPDLPVVILSGQESVARAVEIMKLRPYDYMVKPVDHDRLLRSIRNGVREFELTKRVLQLEAAVQDGVRFGEIIGGSDRMLDLYSQMEKVIDNDVSVFIQGESGTGKELVAKAIHFSGPRRSGPFVALNCGAIAETLQESELFGHEKGAFTGAVARYRGKFEQAHGGTLFLDEVGELSLAVQTRLLRVLQEGSLHRLGGSEAVKVDVRIISATHRNLESLVGAKAFRQDLYYRLLVFPITVPPLRERRGDIPLLLTHLLKKHRNVIGPKNVRLEQDAIDVLCRYDFPGNVRELENIVLRTIVSARSGTIGVDALPPALASSAMGLDEKRDLHAEGDSEVIPLQQVEERAIRHAMAVLGGNLSLAAKRLGVGRSTLYRKILQYGEKENHRSKT